MPREAQGQGRTPREAQGQGSRFEKRSALTNSIIVEIYILSQGHSGISDVRTERSGVLARIKFKPRYIAD